MNKEITLYFAFEKETTGAVRFQESDKDGNQVERGEAKIGTLYVRKSALGGALPKLLTMKIIGK